MSPELVDVTPGTPPTTKWQQPFDAAITDVFQVQADIAGQVASALDVALGAGQKQALAERPTENLAAYDAFLKARRPRGRDRRSAAASGARSTYYEQAVALDSTFALAWAQLSRAHASTTTTWRRTRTATAAHGAPPSGPRPWRRTGPRRSWPSAAITRQVRGRQRQGARGVRGGPQDRAGQRRPAHRGGARRAEPGPVGSRRGHLERAGRLDPRSATRAAPGAEPAPPPALSRGGGRRRPGPGAWRRTTST